MRGLLLGVLGCSLFLMAQGFYSANDDVVELNPSNFNREVLQSNSLWLIEFYAPWCGHCQSLTADWKKTATALKGIVKVGAVDADQHKSLGGQYGVRGFPTIKIFGANKNKPDDYQVDGALNALRTLVKDRMSGRSGGSDYSKQSGGGGGDSKKNVVELTDDNFDRLVLDSGEVWLVEFFAPWCGHCKSLEPEWAAAASAVKEQTKDKVHLGAVDATVHQGLASRYGIFKKGEEPEDYQGGRTRGDIIARALDLFSDNAAPPELLEILNPDVLKKTCDDNQLCVIAVLPHILDTGAAGRNSYLEVMMKMAEKYKKKTWGDLSVGRGSTATVGGGALPKINSVEAWDGKDGELPVEDDYDLSDVDLDDDTGREEL
ncbi:unnamed protein product [Coregonus sp. 'balchen']|nr:unnamed protein product [Coregonus sp. 'balchen']